MEVLAGVDWIAHWRALVEGREQQAEAHQPRDSASKESWWDRRAVRFNESMKHRPRQERLEERVGSLLTPESVLIDVGAGTGRVAIPLASRCRTVIAVEPSGGMLELLRKEVAAAGVDNIEYVQSRWEDLENPPAGDVAIASHSIYGVRDIGGFLRKFNACAEHCLLFLRTEPIETSFPELWETFHGDRRIPEPTFVVAYNVLWQLGIRPDAEILDWQPMMSYASLDDAVVDCQERFSISESDTPRLRSWLEERLRLNDGRLMLGMQPRRAGIAYWRRAPLD